MLRNPISTLNTYRPGNRSLALDFLRGSAVLLVLFRHCAIQPEQADALEPVASALKRFGWTGVDLFFVLSGFLVGGLLFKELIKEGRLDVRRFLLRRGLKIWPAYYAFLLVATLQFLRHSPYPTMRESLLHVLPNLIHLQNYLGTPFGITWTLSVEEHFYLALPLLIFWLSRRNLDALRWFPTIALIVVVVCNLLRLGNLSRRFDAFTHEAPTHLRIDSLIWGVLIAYAYHFHPGFYARLGKYRVALFLLGLLLISPMFLLSNEAPFVWTFGFTLLYLGYGLILIALTSAPVPTTLARKQHSPDEATPSSAQIVPLSPSRAPHLPPFLLHPPFLLDSSFLLRLIAPIGYYSYSIYLWHANVALATVSYYFGYRLSGHMPGPILWCAGMAIYLLVAFLTGVIMAKLIELPFLAWRDRVLPSRSGVVTDASTPTVV